MKWNIHLQKFKSNGLLAHESEINQLQDEGDRLVDMKHPGTLTIKVNSSCQRSLTWASILQVLKSVPPQAHRDSVQSEWQAFLNLCLAQESHLDNIEDYKKVKDWQQRNPMSDS